MKIIVKDKKIVASILQSIHENGHINIASPCSRGGKGDYFFYDLKMFPIRDGEKDIGYINYVDVEGYIEVIIYDGRFEKNFIAKYLPSPFVAYRIVKEYQEHV